MRWDKAAGLLALARALAGSAEGMSLDEMAETAGVDRRTAERMRDALARLFPQLEELPDGRSKRFRIPGGLDGFLQAPSADELAELELAIRRLRAEGATARADLLASLAAKLRTALRAPVRARLAPDLDALLAAEGLASLPGPRPQVPSEVLLTLREALKARRSCNFSYAGKGRRRVEPWGLLLGRVPYLVGPALGKADPVLWRLDRMDGVVLAEAAAGPPPGFDLGAYAARSFGAFQEEPADIELRFSADAAADARRFLFHPGQIVRDEPDGRLTASFRAGGLLELAHHLFTWGDAIEIVRPERLRRLMVEELRRSLACHETPS